MNLKGIRKRWKLKLKNKNWEKRARLGTKKWGILKYLYAEFFTENRGSTTRVSDILGQKLGYDSCQNAVRLSVPVSVQGLSYDVLHASACIHQSRNAENRILGPKTQFQVFGAHNIPMVPEKQFRNIAWQQFTQYQQNHSKSMALTLSSHNSNYLIISYCSTH